MRVAFDSRPAGNPGGTGRYARCLLTALRATPRGEVIESRDPHGCDLFHAPWIEGALLRSTVPTVVTLHDLVPLKRPGQYLRSGLRVKLRYLAVQRATRLIVPTQAVAQDAIRELRIEPGRISTIPEAAAPVFWPRSPDEVATVRARYGLPERYLLWVGGMLVPDPRKRVAALAKARRSLPLVLAGPAGRWARELADVHLTGVVSDDELATIYTGAHALVFPSDDEGFGLPPLEALACGTPVAACDVPALREVLDGRVSLTDVGDLDGLVRTAEALSRPAVAPPDWSWDDAAAATWDVYAQAMAAPAHSGARRPNRGVARRRAGAASRRRRS
jgi:glycosyltransferase involved in cell wall biosynthesis